MQLHNKTIWITGASSGIGEELAYECARKGASLIISSSNKTKLELVSQHCQALGVKCNAVPFDIADPLQINQAVSIVLQLVEKIDVLINNAGVSQRSLTLETSLETDRKIMEINFFGTTLLTKKVLPFMIRNGGGTIAVTSSISGKFGVPLRSMYSASKHALHGFFETIRLEYKKDNIRVTIVCPGWIKTEISIKALSSKGLPYGKMDAGQANGMSAAKCARLYIRAIEKNKKEINIGGKEIIVLYLKRFLPAIFYKVISNTNPT